MSNRQQGESKPASQQLLSPALRGCVAIVKTTDHPIFVIPGLIPAKDGIGPVLNLIGDPA
jgi:hypothetical protein